VKRLGRGGQQQQRQQALGEEEDFTVHASLYGKVQVGPSVEVVEAVISRPFVCWCIGVTEGGWLPVHLRACEIHLEMSDPHLEVLLLYVLEPSHGVALVDGLFAKENEPPLGGEVFLVPAKVINKMSRRTQISE
jgi:hypothetical protein